MANQINVSKMPLGVGELYSVFRRNLLRIVCLVLIGLLGGIYFALSLPDVYTVDAKIALQPTDSELFEAVPETADPNLNTETIATELEVISSRILASRIVDQLDLMDNPDFNLYLKANEQRPNQPGYIAEFIVRVKGLLGLSNQDGAAGDSEEAGRAGRLLSLEAQRERTITRLISMISVDRVGLSTAINISVSNEDPYAAVEIANAVANEYLALSAEKRRETTQKAIAFLTLRANELGKQVSEDEQRLAEHLINHRLTDLQYEASLRAEIEQLKVQRQIALNSSAENNALDTESIENELKTKQAMLSERNIAEIEKRKMERDVQSGQERYQQIISRLGNLDLQAEPLNPPGKILSYAQFPTEASSPKRLLIVLAGVLAGVVVALLITVLREGLDNRVHNEEGIARFTGIPILGMVPEIKQRKWRSRILPHEYLSTKPFSHYADAIRQLFTGCHGLLPSSAPSIIMLTSCVQDEGKTTTALSMAFSAAREERRTVLLDVDFHKCGASREAGITDEVCSLDEVLAGKCSLDEAIYHHPDQPFLDIVGFPNFPTNAEKMVNRAAMESVLKQLKKKYQLVVVDTPPVLLASSATFMAKFVDLVVIVVRWGHTDTETLSGVLKKLQLYAAVPLGIAISRVDFDRQARLRYDSSAKYQAYADHYYYRN